VWVEDDASVQPQVFGLAKRTWEEDCPAGEPATIETINKPERKLKFPAFSAPDKLGEYWLLTLETELRPRRYSPKTRGAYIYFIRALCRVLQKTPEEIGPGDVKKFLAIMEKLGYSAAAMN
jgi:hypothetical protein